jgi:predicted ribosome quality control (RQC) complex YloA/Tae2 family protein
MPIDTFFVSAIAAELQSELEGARIDKIYQPADRDVILALRSPQGSHRLLFSMGNTPRVHLTRVSRENPPTAPMFCMLLRKYLSSSKLLEIVQVPGDRVLITRWETLDEMGSTDEKLLIAEMMGRNANLILVSSDNRVVDCMVRSGLESPRPVGPGLFYQSPPSVSRMSLSADVLPLLDRYYADFGTERPIEEFLMETLQGFSPFAANACAVGDWHSNVQRLIEQLSSNQTHLYCTFSEDGNIRDFACYPFTKGNAVASPVDMSVSELLDDVYTKGELRRQFAQKGSDLRKLARNTRDRIQKKILIHEQTLLDSKNRERTRQFGDLLMANLHLDVRGQTSLEVDDFYSEQGTKVSIPLDPKLRLAQNASSYYREYRKMKNAEIMQGQQLELSYADLSYWESVLEELDRVTSEKDLKEIREEISPAKSRNPKQKKMAVQAPETAISDEGFVLKVGRNNRQNDELTFKMTEKNDIWLHAQKIPGAHVVIFTRGQEPGEQTIFQAAVLAAVHCQSAEGGKVPVDYARVKYVKKPPGAKPGMVIYREFKTILVEPDKELALRLLNQTQKET